MKMRFICLLVLFSSYLLAGCPQAADSAAGNEVVPGLPVKNTVTLIDLGAKTCIPCKMMAPILEELKKEYEGRAAVVFIDVHDEANKGKAQAFKIMAIPSQIFYGRDGREVSRHMGFMEKKDIKAQLDAILAGK